MWDSLDFMTICIQAISIQQFGNQNNHILIQIRLWKGPLLLNAFVGSKVILHNNYDTDLISIGAIYHLMFGQWLNFY